MLSRFFIDRPVFAWVLAIVMMMVGAIAVATLPVMQYPALAPPQVSIAITYPGASAQTVQDTTVQVIEQQLNGIDNLDYITSESNADGTAAITLTFAQGTNPDTAQVQVQNKLQLAAPLIPQEVQQQGIRVTKPTRNFLVVLGFVSADGSMTGEDLGDYVATNLVDQLNRTAGVGDVQLFGSQYAMRIWLDPAKLTTFSLTTADVIAAIRAQNVQVSAGQIGGLPATDGQEVNASIIGPTRMSTPEEFRQILVRVNQDGSQILLRDVARVSLNSESYIRDTKYNGKPAAGVAIRLALGQNALDTVKAIHATLDRLEPFYPHGMQTVYPLDTTPFVRTSIEEVVKTLVEAVVLVFLVIYLFLQNLRATLIPTIAVPVVLLGTFGVLAAFGYTINVLTMFGLALSIGLLVDDAIVVIENVERVMAEEHLSPREATRKSMDQITGALVGIALVLAAVFVPMAFFGGTVGVIYRQFSLTMVSAMLLSVLTALIFTPALCATLLKPVPPGGHRERRGFFRWFNRGFAASGRRYERGLRNVLARPVRMLVIYGAVVAIVAVLFVRLPSSFIPDEDAGILYGQVQTPPGASREMTWAALDEAQEYFLGKESGVIDGVFTVAGFNFAGSGQNSGLIFVKLKDWSERKRADQSVQALAARAARYFASLKNAVIIAIVPPAALELGNATGFDMQLQNRGGLGHDEFLAARNQLLGAAGRNPAIVGVRPNGVEDAPQFKLDIDREKASALSVSIADINQTLSTAWASTYVNDFIDHGRVKRVYVQGEPKARMQPDDLNLWYVRNAAGAMVPFSAFAAGGWTYGPQKLVRFNGVPAFEIQGAAAPGRSSGESMQIMEDLVSKLPNGVGLEWTGLSFEERLGGSQAPALYAISLAVVFLCLAALYESWTIPVTVLLVVPLGVLGAVVATWLRGFSNDAYFQVALLTTIGLAAKNAVLIVEFAKENFDRGQKLKDAVMHAAQQRLRPIIMTSLAFSFGVLPLAIASGAGSGAQNAVGTGVVGGMLASTFLAIFFVPVFFSTVLAWFRVRPTKVGTPSGAVAPEASTRPPHFVPAPAAALVVLAGCTLAPRYEQPAAPVAAAFRGTAAEQGATESSAADVGWREFFPDPQLQDLVARALASNRDLRVAALNVEQARARYRIQRADQFPALDASVAGSAQRVSADLSDTGDSYVTRQYSVGVGLTAFELDLFGRVRSLKRSALEQYLSLDETRTATQLALVGEVANAWLTLVADRELLRLSRETLASQQDSLQLTRMRFDAGVVSEVDLHQSEIAVHQAEVNIATYTRRAAQDFNALELLIGEPLPADFAVGEHALASQVFRETLPAGLPGDLLERRPDIRAAEHDLRASNADVGAARAAFYPRITLTGFGGLAHRDLGDLFDSGGRTWSFVPQLSVPIFAGGANRASLDVSQVRKRIEVARYEQAIQGAFREVSDALAARATLDEQLQAQTALEAAAESSYRLADMRYRGGVDSHLTSLIAQRDLFAAEQALIDVELARAANLVLLYKALGGGQLEASR